MRLLILLCCSIIGVFGDPIVEGSLGTVTGTKQRVGDVDIELFLGIPYAKPPVRDLRFALPQAYGPLGDFRATEYGPACQQPSSGPIAPKNRKLSEDCLRLNIFRKRGTSKNDTKSVIATIHGGGYVAGSSSDLLQHAAPLAGFGDVIVVSLNYRLGILGFADMKEFAPGNLGLHDQRLALRWIRDNIADFGGDPERITVMGVSAGSMSVAAHIITPVDNENLFKSAVMDAGVVTCNGFHENSESSYARLKKVATQLGCPIDSPAMVDCLRTIDAEELISFSLNTTGENGISYFVATTDGSFIPRDVETYVRENSANLRKVRVIIGYAKDEGTFFVGSNFMKRDYPSPQSTDDALEYLEKLSFNYDHRLDFSKQSTMKSVSDLYLDKYPENFFHGIAAFQSDGIFKCAINNFIRSYSRHNDEVYVYQFDRRLRAKYAKILDPDVLGAFHLSPYLHFSGALLLSSDPIHPEDRVFMFDSMNLIASFAGSDEQPRYRGIDWPSFSKSGSVMHLDEEPMMRKGLPSEVSCRELYSAEETSQAGEPKTEL